MIKKLKPLANTSELQRCISDFSTGRFKIKLCEIKCKVYDKKYEEPAWLKKSKLALKSKLAFKSRLHVRRFGLSSHFQERKAVKLIHRPTGIEIETYLSYISFGSSCNNGLTPKRSTPLSKREIRLGIKEFVKTYMPIMEILVKKYLQGCVYKQFGPTQEMIKKHQKKFPQETKESIEQLKQLEQVFGPTRSPAPYRVERRKK